MILPGGKYHAYLATRPVDFRKGHAGLSLVIQTVLGRDPYSGAVLAIGLEPMAPSMARSSDQNGAIGSRFWSGTK